MSDPREPLEAPAGSSPRESERHRPPRQMARPVGPQQGTVSRLDLASGGRPRGANGTAGAEARQAGEGEDRATGAVSRLDALPAGRLGPARPRRRTRLPLLAFLLALAAFVVVGGLTVLRPVLADAAVNLAADNPGLMRYPIFGDLVKSHLGAALTDPAGSDLSPVSFVVPAGASADQIATALAARHLLTDPLAFEYLAVTSGSTAQIRAGTYTLTQTMTPQQLLDRLQQPPDALITLALRQGLRLEQITAYLQTRGLGPGVAQDFYDLATHPTPDLMAAYPFLAALPKGHTLEGFMGYGTFQVAPTATASDILKKLLDLWQSQIGTTLAARLEADPAGFYRALILASIVQQETALDSERALIAGVYANRLNPRVWSTGILNADPTVIYANDTLQLRAMPFEQWQLFSFWEPLKIAYRNLQVPSDLASFQTYANRGLPAWPICSPNLASLQAALAPDTSAGYLYFVAKTDGSHSHAFARTNAEFQALLRKYGYIK